MVRQPGSVRIVRGYFDLCLLSAVFVKQAHRNIARIFDTLGNTRDSLSHNRAALKLGPGALTGGVVIHWRDLIIASIPSQSPQSWQRLTSFDCLSHQMRDSADTDTYRVVARQTVARQEYSNGRGWNKTNQKHTQPTGL